MVQPRLDAANAAIEQRLLVWAEILERAVAGVNQTIAEIRDQATSTEGPVAAPDPPNTERGDS